MASKEDTSDSEQEILQDVKKNILEKQIRKLESLQDETEIDKIIKKINKTKTELTKALNQLKKFKTEAIYEWDQYFMSIACLVALASNDVDSPVGACIVTPNKTVVGVGNNSMPNTRVKFPWKGRTEEVSQEQSEAAHYDFDRKFLFVVHAIVNAITNKTIPSLEGCTIYATMPPDRDCAHAIIQSGITTVKYAEFYNRNPGEKQKERPRIAEIQDAIELLNQTDIHHIPYNMSKPEPHVIITDDKIPNGKKDVWLKGRINKDTTDVLSLPELYMSIAKLSQLKQGHHEESPQATQGACIVDRNNKILSVGHSGFPEVMNARIIQNGSNSQRPYYDGDPFITHAEYQAILGKGAPSFHGCTLYVTKHPCHGCAQVIIQSGIKEVIYDEEGIKEINGHSIPYTLEQLAESNEKVTENPIKANKDEWKKQAKTNSYLAAAKIMTKIDVEKPDYKIEVVINKRTGPKSPKLDEPSSDLSEEQ